MSERRLFIAARLVGIMEKGRWVGGFTQEKVFKSREIFAKWEQEISCPCIVFKADMEEVVICEKHLKEVLFKKEFLENGQNEH